MEVVSNTEESTGKERIDRQTQSLPSFSWFLFDSPPLSYGIMALPFGRAFGCRLQPKLGISRLRTR